MTALSAVTCPVCGAPFNRLENNCPYCGVLVVIKSDHHRIDATKLNRSVINERIHEYRQALKKDRDDATAHYGLGVAYFNLGLIDESIDELSEASRIMPENPHIQAQLGVVLNEAGRQRGPEFTNRAWERLERALMLDPQNEDALVLREDLLKQRLRSPNVSPAEHATARRQLMETWRTLARVDEDRARPLIASFLKQNEAVLRALPKRKATLPKTVRSKEPKAGGWFWRSLGLAALTLVLLFLMFGIFLEVFPEEDGETIGTVPNVVLGILAFSIFIAPVVVFIRGYVRRQKRSMASTQSTIPVPEPPQDITSSLLDGSAPVARMLDAAEAILTVAGQHTAATNRQEFARD